MTNALRLALRSLLRSPAFFSTAVLSLALAIGAATSAFSVIDAVRFRALPFRNGDQLVVIGEIPAARRDGAPPAPCTGNCTVSYATYTQLLRAGSLHTVDHVVAYATGGKAFARDGDVVAVTGGVVSANAFELLGARPILGRTLTPDDDRLGVPLTTVLSYGMWRDQFGGDSSVIGRVIKLSDSQYTVVGVMEPGFDFEAGSDFWLPVVPTLDPSTKPSITSVTVFARLRDGASVTQLRDELRTYANETDKAGSGKSALVASPLRERYATATQSYDLAFGAIVACILLIACANLANLILVRTLHRKREFAVRAALGASARKLSAVVFAENTIIVGVSAVSGIVLASFALGILRTQPLLNGLRPTAMEYRVDFRVVVFAVVVSALAAAIISLVPARLATRSDVQHLLRGAGAGRVRSWARHAFVVAQIACAMVLVTGGALMARTTLNVARVNVGFDADKLITATPSYPHTWRDKSIFVPTTDRILKELQSTTGVELAALRTTVALGSRNQPPSIFVQGSPDAVPSSATPANALSISPGYFQTIGVKTIAGRAFTDADIETSMSVAIVNQWAAQRWFAGRDPIGQTIRIQAGDGQPVVLSVVGVVANSKAARPNLLLAQDGAELYRPYAQAPTSFPVFLARASGDPRTLVTPVRQLMTRMVPDRPLGSAVVSQNVRNQFAGVERNAIQIAAFAGIGLLLALVGIYGVLSFDVSSRSREIGIRAALGASRGAIAQRVLLDASQLTALGVLVGVPVSLAAAKLIQGLLFETSASDPVTYAVVGLSIVGVAMLAAYVPARKAATVDPVTALRAD